MRRYHDRNWTAFSRTDIVAFITLPLFILFTFATFPPIDTPVVDLTIWAVALLTVAGLTGAVPWVLSKKVFKEEHHWPHVGCTPKT